MAATEAQDDLQTERIVPDKLEVPEPVMHVAPQPAAVTPLGVGAARLPLGDVTNRPGLTRSRTITNSKPLIRPPWRL
ncbi:uncharacterized protein SCHCODRAFT_01038650, partial [Schizophyllum commune H4-8]|uniref:Expressed protein n=1 Tax=Schizophyllum commune (strain H4-8 / FGSC 9210) TaxID=578458 RepID=D8Q7H0_SCHCM